MNRSMSSVRSMREWVGYETASSNVPGSASVTFCTIRRPTSPILQQHIRVHFQKSSWLKDSTVLPYYLYSLLLDKKIWGEGGGRHWLVRMEWHPAGWSVCLPLLIFPYTIKSRSSLLEPAHPGGPRKRAIKWLWWWCGIRQEFLSKNCALHFKANSMTNLQLCFIIYAQSSTINTKYCL